VVIIPTETIDPKMYDAHEDPDPDPVVPFPDDLVLLTAGMT
jgi:hypothetical protein